MSRDSGGESGAFNLYADVYNSPLNYIDPNGSAPILTALSYNPCKGTVSVDEDQQFGQGYGIGLHSPWNTPSQMILNQRADWEQTTCCQSTAWYLGFTW